MCAMALFSYMGASQELENLGHMVFRQKKFIVADLRPVVIVLHAVHVGYGPFQVHGVNVET